MSQFPFNAQRKSWGQVRAEIHAQVAPFDIATLPQEQQDALAAQKEKFEREGTAVHLFDATRLKHLEFARWLLQREIISELEPSYEPGTIIKQEGISLDELDRAENTADAVKEHYSNQSEDAIRHLALLMTLSETVDINE